MPQTTPDLHPTSTSPREEAANALTHGVAAVAALVASGVLIIRAARHGDGWQLAGAIVFGAALFMLYVASTLYHASSHPRAKSRLQVLDHCAIYVLIAGTYTPFTLTSLRGPWGWGLFSAIWALALAGGVFKLFFTGRFDRMSTLLYLGMGWLVVIAIKPLFAVMDAWTLGWLFGGRVFYSLGTLFYLRESQPYAHAIWHLFVIAGSVCHYLAVFAQVA